MTGGARTRPPAIGRVAVLLVLLLVCAAFASGAGAHAAPAPTPSCPGSGTQLGAPVAGGDETPGVTRVVFTFVDRSRPTAPDRDNEPGDPQGCRVLRTAVRWPAGAQGPRPLILAVHGRDGDPTRLRPLFDAWVAAGYVVAAPFFLVTQKGDDDKPTGAAMRRQVADAKFVLDRLLQLNADPTSAIHGLVDPQRIGAAGMSLGGMTVYGLVSNTCCRDRRIGAAVLLAAVYRPFPGGRYVRPQPPALLVQGDEDDGYHNSVSAYPKLAPPKWFITLKGSEHSPPFEIPRGPEADVVDDATTAFWNLYLSGRTAAAHKIVEFVEATRGGASLKRQLGPAAR